mmetsp:Transcript_20805/g.32576  ORF Transcript_20805/g.32576 Transcript_20805/m.32576 type:complete len:208 (-) Transcript_20805:297-920(-)
MLMLRCLQRRLSSEKCIHERIDDSIISSRLDLAEQGSAGDKLNDDSPQEPCGTKSKQDGEGTPTSSSYSQNDSDLNLPARISDMIERLESTQKHHRNQDQPISHPARHSSYHESSFASTVGSRESTSEIILDGIENADESACGSNHHIKAKNNKKKGRLATGVEEARSIDRQALESQRIEFAIAAVLFFISSILIGLLFALWPLRTL